MAIIMVVIMAEPEVVEIVIVTPDSVNSEYL